MSSTFPDPQLPGVPKPGLISNLEASTLLLLRHLRDLAHAHELALGYVEHMMYKQLEAAVGKVCRCSFSYRSLSSFECDVSRLFTREHGFEHPRVTFTGRVCNGLCDVHEVPQQATVLPAIRSQAALLCDSPTRLFPGRSSTSLALSFLCHLVPGCKPTAIGKNNSHANIRQVCYLWRSSVRMRQAATRHFQPSRAAWRLQRCTSRSTPPRRCGSVCFGARLMRLYQPFSPSTHSLTHSLSLSLTHA